MNTDELEYVLTRAERRVLEIQTKLHRWAREGSHRKFSDLFNLAADPAFLLVAWARVRGNKGARTAGVDGETAYYVETVRGVENFLDGLRNSIKDRSFCPLPVRERMIPKPGGKQRRLGIATVRDRVVQASLKLVLEPVFEADFLPCSYGFRPNHRAHDAVAEVRHFTSHSYEWIVEGDIKACFDEISHAALMDRVRACVGDKRVLALVKAFLKSGFLGEDRAFRETSAGTPQGSILSPLLSNVPLRPGRAHRPGPGRSGEHLQRPPETPPPRTAELPAIARAGTSKKARDISIDKVAVDKRWETSRTAIYAALNGTRLASESTLCAMVIHWDPRGADAIPEWLKIRYDVEEKIITKPVAAELSAQLPTVTASMQGYVAAAPRPPRRRRNVDTAVLVQLAQNLRSAAAESGLSVTQLAVQAHPNRVERPDQSNGGLEKDDWPVCPEISGRHCIGVEAAARSSSNGGGAVLGFRQVYVLVSFTASMKCSYSCLAAPT